MIRARVALSVLAICLGSLLAAALPAAAQAMVTVSVTNNGTFGTMLTDSQGMTLYYRSSDPADGSTCTGVCAQNWPALTVSGTPTAAAGVTGKLTTFTDPAGKTQVAYNGHALYTFVGDKAPGDTKGDGVAKVWHVATVSLAATGTASTTTAAGGTLPKTGSDPIGFAGGVLLALAGLALVLRRPRRSRRSA